MTRAECVREVLSAYRERQAQNERELDARVAEAERLDPEIARLRGDSSSLAFETVKRIMALPDEAARRECAQRMKERGQSNNARIRARLRALGLPEDYLQLRYRCAACRDTGYVGDAPARFCDCFEAEVRRRMHEDGSMAGVREQCFECFDPEVFPEEGGQRARMIRARDLCEEYADSYPDGRFSNLLIAGSIGQGKTFLLNCIYERAIRRGIPAVRVTAFRMFETMRREHFANSADERGFSDLIAAPLLLIDDLGTEPMMRNVTVEYLFTLLNERAAARRGTVVATNLAPVQLKERYGERVASRILDRSCGAALMLSGRDIRLL